MAALARCRDGDPQRAVEAIGVAERPHLHLFIATSDIHLKHKLEADARAGARRRPQMGLVGPRDAGTRRGDRVLGRGRVADRGVVPARGLRGRRRGRRLDRQHPRHRGLRDPGRVRPRSSARVVDLVGARRDRQRPLPQRPRARDREHAGRRPGRRAPGGGHHQRPRRAGRQRVAGGGRDGPPDAPQPVPGAGRQVQTEQLTPASRLVVVPHRLRDPAQQGDRRRQRVRPRVRDPPGRVPQEPADLRDHDPAVRRPVRAARCRSASCPAGAGSRASSGSWATRSTARRSTPIYRAAIALADSKKDVTDADLLALVEQRHGRRPALDRAARLEHQLVQRRALGGQRVAGRGRARRRPPTRPATARSTRCSRRSTRPSSRSSAGTRSSPSTRSRPCPPARTRRARCSCAAAARTTRARARSSSPGTGYRPTSSRRRSRPTSSRPTSSTAPRSTAIEVAFVGRRTAEELP